MNVNSGWRAKLARRRCGQKQTRGSPLLFIGCDGRCAREEAREPGFGATIKLPPLRLPLFPLAALCSIRCVRDPGTVRTYDEGRRVRSSDRVNRFAQNAREESFSLLLSAFRYKRAQRALRCVGPLFAPFPPPSLPPPSARVLSVSRIERKHSWRAVVAVGSHVA